MVVIVTNGYNTAQVGSTCEGCISNFHVTFKAVGGHFFIGNFPSEKDCPGIPLDPEILARRETVHVDWVELEFKDLTGKYQVPSQTEMIKEYCLVLELTFDTIAMQGFMNLWNALYSNNK